MREKWVDNIKFIAAVGVFLGHYVEAFAVMGADVPKWLGLAHKYPLSLIVNGQFWVCVFAILSGYLLGKKKIDSINSLIKGCVNRYYRFVIPFFFANFFVYFLSKCCGFSANECGILIKNEWLMQQYVKDIELLDVIKNSVLLGDRLNNSFWIIKHMCIASWLIYISSFICHKMKDQRMKIVISIVLLIFPYTFFIGAVYIGSIFSTVTEEIAKKIPDKILTICFWTMLLLLSGMQNMIAEIIGLQWIRINQYYEIIYAMSMLGCISSQERLLKIFSSNVINRLSKQSMTIYLLHWPIICSFGTWCFMVLMGKSENFYVYYYITLCTIIILLAIVVYCYEIVIGKCSDWVLNKITLKQI